MVNIEKCTNYTTRCQVKPPASKTDKKESTASSTGRYNITLHWKVNFSKNKKKNISEYKKVTLEKIDSKYIEYIGTEKSAAIVTAKNAICNWYRDINSNPDLARITKNAALKPLDASKIDCPAISVELNGNSSRQTINVTGKEFSLFMQDPWPAVLKGLESHYTDPISAYRKIKPVFTLDVDIVANTAQITNVNLSNVRFIPPVSDSEKDRILSEATQFAGSYNDKLTEFATTKDRKMKKQLGKEIEEMFVDKKKPYSSPS